MIKHPSAPCLFVASFLGLSLASPAVTYLIYEDFETKTGANTVFVTQNSSNYDVEQGPGNPLYIDGTHATSSADLKISGTGGFYWYNSKTTEQGANVTWVAKDSDGNNYLRLGSTRSNFFLHFSTDGTADGVTNFIDSSQSYAAGFDYTWTHTSLSSSAPGNSNHGAWLTINTPTNSSNDGFTLQVSVSDNTTMLYVLRDPLGATVATGTTGGFTDLLAKTSRKDDNDHGSMVPIYAEWTGWDMQFYIGENNLVWDSAQDPNFNPAAYTKHDYSDTKVMISGQTWGYSGIDNVFVAQIPEPSLGLLGGLSLLGFLRRRR